MTIEKQAWTDAVRFEPESGVSRKGGRVALVVVALVLAAVTSVRSGVLDLSQPEAPARISASVGSRPSGPVWAEGAVLSVGGQAVALPGRGAITSVAALGPGALAARSSSAWFVDGRGHASRVAGGLVSAVAGDPTLPFAVWVGRAGGPGSGAAIVVYDVSAGRVVAQASYEGAPAQPRPGWTPVLAIEDGIAYYRDGAYLSRWDWADGQAPRRTALVADDIVDLTSRTLLHRLGGLGGYVIRTGGAEVPLEYAVNPSVLSPTGERTLGIGSDGVAQVADTPTGRLRPLDTGDDPVRRATWSGDATVTLVTQATAGRPGAVWSCDVTGSPDCVRASVVRDVRRVVVPLGVTSAR